MTCNKNNISETIVQATLRKDILNQLHKANYRQQCMIKHYTTATGGDREDICQDLLVELYTCPAVQEYKSLLHWAQWPGTTLYYKAVYAAIKYYLKKVYNKHKHNMTNIQTIYLDNQAENYEATMNNLKTKSDDPIKMLREIVSEVSHDEAILIFWRLHIMTDEEAQRALGVTRKTIYNRFNAFKAKYKGAI